MTPDEIAAERERFEAWIVRDTFGNVDRAGSLYLHTPTHYASSGYFARAAIARVEQAELRSENERLRERVREMLKNELYMWIQQFPSSQAAWAVAGDRILGMAQQVGCWWSDGNEVPLAEWRARMGGVG